MAKGVKLIPLDHNMLDGKVLKVSAALNPKLEAILVDFLHANVDMLVWSSSDMPGILTEVSKNFLDI